jgi:dGTPase
MLYFTYWLFLIDLGCGMETWYEKRFLDESIKEQDHRSDYEKDRCKVLHSYTFRRLQGKIQIVRGNESDFHRNRLTHSIEVASIAKNIYDNICYRKNNLQDDALLLFLSDQKKNDIDTLLFTIGLLHDIGHPPFGHGGEIALNYKMHKFGGFEGNAQTLRLITRISPLNLTYRTLLGTLKYPVKYSTLVNEKLYPNAYDKRTSDFIDVSRYLIPKKEWQPPKCYYDQEDDLVEKLLQSVSEKDRLEFQSFLGSSKHGESKYKTFDCSIMDIADDISYSIHDLEDAIFFNMIRKEDLESFFDNQDFIADWKAYNYPDKLLSKDLDSRKKAISSLVHKTIIQTNVKIHTKFTEPLFKYYVDFEDKLARDFIQELKKMVRDKLIETQQVKSIIHGGMVVIMQLFDAFVINPELLPSDELSKIDFSSRKSESMRVIADYISGMTDQYLFKMHQRIYGANSQNTFDII